MRFIQLTERGDGTGVQIDADRIAVVRQEAHYGAAVELDNGRAVHVRETAEDVVRKAMRATGERS